MVRGLFTAASGMLASQDHLNVISNNLANVDKTAFKRQTAVFKAFPDLLIRRMNDDGMVQIPIGSYDAAPVVGRLGTGVEFNDAFTSFEQGNGLRQTGNDFDLALEGRGFFTVMTDSGERYTRNGSFLLDKDGFLVTKDGYKVLGENGPVQVQANNFFVDEFGRVWTNSVHTAQPDTMVDREQNGWEQTVLLDQLQISNFHDPRELAREGNSFFRETRYSGPAQMLDIGQGRPKVHQGFLETSNVNPVLEMVRMIEVHRTYEANQKMVQTQDELLGKLLYEVGRGV